MVPAGLARAGPTEVSTSESTACQRRLLERNRWLGGAAATTSLTRWAARPPAPLPFRGAGGPAGAALLALVPPRQDCGDGQQEQANAPSAGAP
jgi:hypothetical protein